MQDFDIQIKTRLIFGRGKEKEFYKATAGIGKRVFLVTGGGSVKRLGYLDRVMKGLEKQGCEITHFEGIEPNPTAATVNKAAKSATESKADLILALGGGSTMDAAKAIAVLVHDGEDDIWPFVLGEPRFGKLKGAIPIIAVPTTAATASEVTPFSVISNSEVNGKSPIVSQFICPTVSWLNPEFTLDLPPTVTRDGASDIISHIFENYILGGNDSPFADRYSEGILLTVMETLPEIIEDPKNYDLRARMLWASNMALNGYQQTGREASDFVMHSIEHVVSGYYPEIAHGRGLATIYPAYFRKLWEMNRARDRFAQLGRRLFGVDAGDVSIAALGFFNHFEQWLKENELWQSFEDLGVDPAKYRDISQSIVSVYGDGKQLEALGPITIDDLIDMLQNTARQKK